MNLSITTDYAQQAGSPQPYLRRIAEAGFTHVHWCHHWNTDFLYSRPEIEQIERWLREFGLGVTDVHGSAGQEKAWMAPEEYRRLAGVELVQNRIRMAARLGADVVIMHVPALGDPAHNPDRWDQARRSLDAVEPCARECGVRIALENGKWDDIERLLALYPPDYVGLCYDSGHGNMDGAGLDRLEAGPKQRLISIHLHDNDGTQDLHNIPFTGTVDWGRLARLIAGSPYAKWVNLECLIANSGMRDEEDFLSAAREAGEALTGMIAGQPGRAAGSERGF